MILVTCVNDFVKMCNISQTRDLKSDKHPAVGQYNDKYHSATSEEIVMSCNHGLKNHHVISSQVSYGLLYVKFWAIPLQMVDDTISSSDWDWAHSVLLNSPILLSRTDKPYSFRCTVLLSLIWSMIKICLMDFEGIYLFYKTRSGCIWIEENLYYHFNKIQVNVYCVL
jgi:hypothetical protein